MATDVRPPLADFDPASFEAFRFVACELDARGGDATRIQRTAAVAAVPRLVAARRLDPGLSAINRAGALNGHIPVTAIVSCIALLTAALDRRARDAWSRPGAAARRPRRLPGASPQARAGR